jgi:hypothetical protein
MTASLSFPPPFFPFPPCGIYLSHLATSQFPISLTRGTDSMHANKSCATRILILDFEGGDDGSFPLHNILPRNTRKQVPLTSKFPSGQRSTLPLHYHLVSGIPKRRLLPQISKLPSLPLVTRVLRFCIVNLLIRPSLHPKPAEKPSEACTEGSSHLRILHGTPHRTISNPQPSALGRRAQKYPENIKRTVLHLGSRQSRLIHTHIHAISPLSYPLF